MANLVALKDYIITGVGNLAVKIRLTDNGDGTFSEGLGGSGGGGGAVTIADGAAVSIGAKADATATSDGGTFSLIALIKRVSAGLTNLSASVASTSNSVSYEASRAAKATSGTLFSVSIFNSAAVSQFYQLHNAASLPSNGAAPASIIKIPAGGSGGWDFGVRGRPFSTGIVISNSSTGPTLTVGAADSYYDAVIG